MKALLVLSLLISGNVLAQQYPPASFPPGSYPSYPQPGRVIEAPVITASPVKVVKVPVEWPKTLEDNDIPEVIRRNDILKDFYKKFVMNTTIPDKKSLRVGDKKSKFKCITHSFTARDQDFDQDEFNIRFDTVRGGLDAIELRKTNAEKETGENFRVSLIDKFGWRGVSKKAKQMVDILPDVRKEHLDRQRIGDIPTMWSAGGKIVVKSAGVRVFDTVCIRAKKESVDEPLTDLVIELGERYDTEIRDSEGNVLPISSRLNLIPSEGRTNYEIISSQFQDMTTAYFKKYLPKGSLKSICWADREEENKEGYKLTGIAVCSLETDE